LGYGIGRMVLSVRFYLFVERVCRKAFQAGPRISGATKRTLNVIKLRIM